MTDGGAHGAGALDVLTATTSYLRHTGWRRQDEDGRTSLWQPPAGVIHDDVRVVLPTSLTLTDAGQLLDEAARAVAWVEQRTADEVLHDARTGGVDRMAVHLPASGNDGELSLTSAANLLTALRDLVTGAAVGVESAGDLVLAPRRPARVEAYVGRAQISTRPGSFIVDVALPGDDPQPLNAGTGEGSIDVLLPYGRRVTSRLLQVTKAAAALARRVGDGDGDLTQFASDAALTGNATELNALSRLGSGVEQPSRYQLRIAQTPLWGGGAVPPEVLAITPAQQAVLAEAATYLRERRSRPDVTVEGLVVRLAREHTVGPGGVVVEGVDDDTGARRRYAVNLSEVDYRDALRAHEAGYRVVVVGDLDVRGTRKTLKRIKSFDVLARPTED